MIFKREKSYLFISTYIMKKWYKVCPYCANEIKEAAIKCQYCWEFLPEKKNEEKKKKVKRGKCPFCMNDIDLNVSKCPFCDEKIEQIKELQKWDDNKISEKEVKQMIAPNEEWIYHCPNCWNKVEKWYLECINCQTKLEWSEEDTSSDKDEALREAEKWMSYSFVVTIIIILVYAVLLGLTMTNSEILKYTLLSWFGDKYEVMFYLFAIIIIFGIMSVCMKLFKNRIAFIFMFLDYLISFFVKLVDENMVGKGIALIMNAFLIYAFFKWMCGSFLYRSIIWKNKLSVDEWILLIVCFIATMLITSLIIND